MRKQIFIQNAAAKSKAKPMTLLGRRSSVTVNLLPKQVRNATLDGKDYLVVPMVMMTEGVHNGSDGQLYYPSDELGKTPVVWNTKPVVVYHPEVNGQALSATDPIILQNNAVGMIMNTKFEGTRLKAEAWIDREKANRVDDRIIAGITANEVMEVSTGLFVDVEEDSGTWNKEKYVGIARNYRPDHLALLPDQIGACSIADGAGLMRNTAKGQPLSKTIFLANINKLARQFRFEVTDAKELTANDDQSFDDIEQAVWCALCQRYGIDDSNIPSGATIPWLYDTYSNYVVYNFNGQLFQLGYELDDNGDATLDSTPPIAVECVEKYVPVGNAQSSSTTTYGGYLVDDNGVKHLPTEQDGKLDHTLMGAAWAALHGGFRGNKYDGPSKDAAIAKLTALYKQEGMTLPTSNNENTMNKKDKISAIITANKGWAESDRAKLDAFAEPQIDTIHTAVTAPAPVVNAAAPVTATVPPVATTPATAVVANTEAPKVKTMDQYIADAPVEMQSVLRNSVGLHQKEKARLVAGIVANKQNTFTKETLESKDLQELTALAALAAVPAAPVASYIGNQEPVTNADAEEPLELPTTNRAKSKKSKGDDDEGDDE